MAAHSGSAGSAASASPSLRPSPPPRSANLGYTILDLPSLHDVLPISSDPNPNSPLHTAPSHLAATYINVEAAAVDLSESLLSDGHRWS